MSGAGDMASGIHVSSWGWRDIVGMPAPDPPTVRFRLWAVADGSDERIGMLLLDPELDARQVLDMAIECFKPRDPRWDQLQHTIGAFNLLEALAEATDAGQRSALVEAAGRLREAAIAGGTITDPEADGLSARHQLVRAIARATGQGTSAAAAMADQIVHDMREMGQ